MTVQSKALILDIETKPLKVLVWQLGKQYVTLDQVEEDWGIISWAAKWLGDKPSKVIQRDTQRKSEKAILAELWKLLNEANIVVTQNGQSFDEPRIKARMMAYGFKPYKPVEHFDTFRQSKDKEFTSHSLDYLTRTFCKKYKKLSHKKFPGLKLWKECLKGNPEAWKEMRTYNIHDVLSTEELYLNTRAWAKKSAPSPLTPPKANPQCLYCKSYRLRSLGIRKTDTGSYRRYICNQCGRAQKDRS